MSKPFKSRRIEEVTYWQPIENCPANKVVIVCSKDEPCRIYASKWTGKRWVLFGERHSLYMRPSHFMEIPEFPKNNESFNSP